MTQVCLSVAKSTTLKTNKDKFTEPSLLMGCHDMPVVTRCLPTPFP